MTSSSRRDRRFKVTTDNIIIKKIWQDSELMELEVICTSRFVTSRSKIYASGALVDELIQKINVFLGGYGHCEEIEWANECKGNLSTACVSFRFLEKDKLGHILIEVFAEVDDGGDYEKHNCCFFVNTEYGLLSHFCHELSLLKSSSSGCEIHLN